MKLNRTEIGRAIGTDALEERRQVASRFWNEWGARLAGLPEEMRRELDTLLQKQIEQALGNAIITHVPGWKSIDFDPSVDGLDLPVPSLITQEGDDGFVTVWWKTDSDDPHAWVPLWGGLVAKVYPGPMTPVGRDDPGDLADNRFAQGKHSHPLIVPPVQGTIFYVCDFENGEGYSDPQSLQTALQPGYATRTSEVSAGSPDNIIFATTELNVPGITSLPAGDWLLRIYLSVDDGDSGDPAGPAKITCALKRKAAGGTVLATLATGIATPDDSNPEWHYVDLTVTIAAGDWNATDRLCLEAVASTTSSESVWVNFGCAGTHGSFVRPPFVSVSTGGSLWHPDQQGRSLEGQHPRYAITDAIGTATITGSGTSTRLVLAAPYRSGEITLSTNTIIYGIDPTGWSDGQVLEVFFDGVSPTGAPLTLVHMAGNADGSDIYCGVNLSTGAGQNYNPTRPVALKFKRRASKNRWQMMDAGRM